MKTKILTIVLFLSLLLFSCSGLTTEGLRVKIKEDIASEITQVDGVRMVDFQLVHQEGNYYNGVLTTSENGEKQVYDVKVTYDGSNYQWEILTE